MAVRAVAACAVGLAAVPAVAEAPGQAYESTEPGAFASGILFHSSIPAADRATLLSDLAWLAGLGTLPDSAPLSRALGLGDGDVQGSRLVDWIAHTVHLVHGTSWCPQSSQVVVSNLNRSYPRSLYATSARCAPPTARGTVYGHVAPYLDHGTYASWRKATRDEADGFVVDDRLLVEGRGPWGLPRIVAIDPGVLFAQKGMSGRVLRVSTLVHEGYHIAGTGHVACQAKGWARATNGIHAFGFRRATRPDLDRACDAARAGAYPVEAMLTHSLRRACGECGADPEIAYREAFQWSSLEVPVRGGGRVPPEVLAAADPKGGLGPVSHVPPREHFQALAEARELQAKAGGCSECAGQAASVRKALASLEGMARRDGLGEAWGGSAKPPRGTPPPGDGVAWLKAASAARASGYNVPLRHAPRCADLSRGCRIF